MPNLNSSGIGLVAGENFDLAIALFRVNCDLYPDSANPDFTSALEAVAELELEAEAKGPQTPLARPCRSPVRPRGPGRRTSPPICTTMAAPAAVEITSTHQEECR